MLRSVLFLLCLSCAVAGWALPEAFPVDPYGGFTVDGQSFRLLHYDSAWRAQAPGSGNFVPAPGYPKVENGGWTLRGKFTVVGGTFDLTQTVRRLTPREYAVTIKLESPAGVATQLLAVCASLPIPEFAGRSFKLDGKIHPIPTTFQGMESMVLADAAKYRSLEIERRGGTNHLEVRSDGAIQFLDSRRWGPEFAIRLNATPAKGMLKKAEISLKVADRSLDTFPIDLRSVANRGFKDEKEGDGKGGWTDQGPLNDLAMMVPGPARLGGVRFDIIDPASNGGTSCLVMDFGPRKEVAVPAGNRRMKYLCVLHATTQIGRGRPAGKIRFDYQDGSSGVQNVVGGEDVANWWGATSLTRAAVVWQGARKSGGVVGLYLGVFPVEDKPVRSISFLNEPNTTSWMIVGLSGSNDPISKPYDNSVYITESSNWRKFEFKRDVEPGSILDFSSLLDAPAGKHGRVVAENGVLSFEKSPGRKLRLYGVNLCFSACYPDHETSKKLAERLARYGVNTVRFHHQDGDMVRKGTTELNPETMDQLDYLFFCLKQQGIYITTDLFASRDVQAGELPGINRWIDRWNGGFKALALADSEARRNWEAFSANFLNHVNPYTGISWKDDPALFSLCLINEGNMDYWINHTNFAPVSELYEKRFREWLKKRNLSYPAAGKEKEGRFREFLFDLQTESFREMSAFLRSIGVKALLTSQNMFQNPRLTAMRQEYDYVDGHSYFDHPSSWSLPSTITNRSAVDLMAQVPAELFPSRIFGKPFTITEINWVFPNRFRAESGVLTGAYSALQDISAVYRFAYSHDRAKLDADSALGNFDTVNDPINLFSDRIGALLFVRGDVESSNLILPIGVPASARSEERAAEAFPPEIWQLAGVGRIGCVNEKDGRYDGFGNTVISLDNVGGKGRIPARLAADNLGKFGDPKRAVLDFAKKFSRSSTGELELDGNAGTFKAVTAASEALVLTRKGKLNGTCLNVDSESPATFCAAAMDGQPLAKSRRILLFHLTDVMNSGLCFLNREMTILDSFGQLPLLVRRGVADVTLKLDDGAIPRIQAVDTSGKPIAAVPATYEKGILKFKADTFAASTPILAYEIIRD